ncbi:MAG: Ig-like domain-containing protein [Clostridia bacterium]|nr:Ig-like domain-containing protein [Clostridia bacterium]
MKISSKLRRISAFVACAVLLGTHVSLASTFNYKDHITSLHTKQEIEQKYNASVDSNYPENEYSVKPNYPSTVGSLKQVVINDTLSRINYYRWLSGLNELTPNYDKMQRNQKGAILLNELGQLTHTPEKPEGMSDEFYNEGFAACYYGTEPGDVYSGNVAYDNFHSLPDLIDLYIADIYNGDTSNGAVGHRLSILDPFGTKASLGKCGNFSTLSIYYESSAEAYNAVSPVKLDVQPYYAYPTAGYFPKQFCYTNEYWSVLVPGGYYLKSSKIAVTIEYDGQQYRVPYVQERSFFAIDFKLPDILINRLGGPNKTMPEGDFKVIVTGFKIPGNSYMNLEYTVSFFDADIPITEIYFEEDSYNIEVGQEAKIELFYSPAAADVEDNEIVWTIADESIASIDSDGVVTAKRPGTTTASVTIQGITKTCDIIVYGDPVYELGDVDRNNIIDANDATYVLELYKAANYSQDDLTLGDLDFNNILDSNDASLILELYKTRE